MNKFELTLSVFSSNIESIISIYNDSQEIRDKRKKDLEEKLKESSWTEAEFQEFTHYQHHFNWLLIHALFITGFSYFENFMKSIAEKVEKEKGGRVKIHDIRGDGYLDRYRKYIHLIGNIEFASSDTKDWNDISDFRKIRNSIAHEYGEVKGIINKIEEHDLYFGPSKKQIRIRKLEFLEDFVRITTKYMKLLIGELNGSTNSEAPPN